MFPVSIILYGEQPGGFLTDRLVLFPVVYSVGARERPSVRSDKYLSVAESASFWQGLRMEELNA